MVARSRRPALGIAQFREMMVELERRALVRLGEHDPDSQDMELDIRAIVATVAGDDFVASLERLAGTIQDGVGAEDATVAIDEEASETAPTDDGIEQGNDGVDSGPLKDPSA